MSALPVMFVWLDKRLGNLPGGNEEMKKKFRKLLIPIRQFDKPASSLDHIALSLKDKHVLFILTNAFADELFLKKLALLPNVSYIYIYDQEEYHHQIDDENLNKKMGLKRIIQFDERLYEQITMDLINMYSNESVRLDKGRDAKDLLESAIKLLNNFDDKDEYLQQMENNFKCRLNQLD